MIALLMSLVATAAPTVVVEPGQVNYGRVTGTVDIPIEAVLAIVEDCEGTDRWFPNTENAHVVRTYEDGSVACAAVMQVPWPLADRSFELRTRSLAQADGSWLVTFDYVEGSGNVEVLHGGYHLVPRGPRSEQTHVVYEAWVDIGCWVPSVILGWATGRVLPGVITGLEEEAARRAGVVAAR